jgi:hypothetical protein
LSSSGQIYQKAAVAISTELPIARSTVCLPQELLFNSVTKQTKQTLTAGKPMTASSAHQSSVLIATNVCYRVVLTCLSQFCRPSSLHLKKIAAVIFPARPPAKGSRTGYFVGGLS